MLIIRGEGGIKLKNKKQPQGKRRQKLQFGHLKYENPPCDLRAMPKCQAVAKTTGRRCGNIAIKGKNVCYLHGGKSPGAPKRNMNALKHGWHTAKSIAERRYTREFIKEAHRLIKEITV